MPALVPLHLLAVGQSAVVKRLTCAGIMRRRLMDLGLINGTNRYSAVRPEQWRRIGSEAPFLPFGIRTQRIS